MDGTDLIQLTIKKCLSQDPTILYFDIVLLFVIDQQFKFIAFASTLKLLALLISKSLFFRDLANLVCLICSYSSE